MSAHLPAHVLRPGPKARNPARALTQTETGRIMNRSTYRTGDGETVGATRPGSQDHKAVPSRRFDERVYRDGRRETV